MIFSYSRASLQNSLSPGTKRHIKDSVQPAPCQTLPHLGNKATSGDRHGFPPRHLPALHLPLSFTADSAYTCPSVSQISFWPASVRPLRGDAYVGRGETGRTCRRARVRGRRWVWSIFKIKSNRKLAILVSLVPFPLRL